MFLDWIPQTVLINSSGAWKLGGFSFSISADLSSTDSSTVQPFHYAVSHSFDRNCKTCQLSSTITLSDLQMFRIMFHMTLFMFIHQEYDVEDSVLPLQPSLNYTAPELVRPKAPSFGCSSDIFSFGCLAYHLIAKKPLFDCHNNVKMVLL